MAGVAGSGNAACGHLVPPGSWFCPVCGQLAADSTAPSQPSTAPLPVVSASPQSIFSAPVSPAAAQVAPSEPPPWESWYAPRRPPPPPPDLRPDPSAGPLPWPSPDGVPPLADPDAAWATGLGPAPSDEVPATMLGGLRLTHAPDGPRRPRRPLVPVIVALALVAVVAGIFVFRGHSGSTAASGSTGSTPSASSQDARRQAAVRLSGLLALSVSDRAAVINAATDVRGCGPSLRQDARTFASSASSRQRLLSRLDSLPGRSLLPATMLQDLTGAWQASAEVDTDLARWAQDTITRGCHHHNNRSDAGLRASYAPESQAAAGKRAFASRWNAVARRYGLTTYQPSQL